MLEIIAANPMDAIRAEAGGADRIELVSAMSEGGLTPSWGMVREIIAAVSIPVHVIIRPHSRSFRYDASEAGVMRADIREVRKLGAAGIVIGALTEEGQVDVSLMKEFLDEAEDMAVTFHRAFDESADLPAAFDAIVGLGRVSRILTSGGEPSAWDGSRMIRSLVERSRSTSVTILAGGGMRLKRLDHFIEETGVDEIHMGAAVRGSESYAEAVDPDRVTLAKQTMMQRNRR